MNMTAEEYRDEGLRLYYTDRDKAVDCFLKAAEGKDIVAALKLADYFYYLKKDKKSAKEWIDKAENWFEEAGQPEKLNRMMAEAINMRGLIYKENAPYLATCDFAFAIDLGMIEAYASYGEMVYKGYDSADGEPEVDRGLSLWKYGMEQGSEECAKLYFEHQFEQTPEDAKEVKFKNGNNYKGQLNEEGLPHGSGRMKYNLNGYIGEYVGQWSNGKRCGMGKYTQSNKGFGSKHTYEYIGEWLDDKEHGQGCSTNADERGVHLSTFHTVHIGSFKDGKANGHEHSQNPPRHLQLGRLFRWRTRPL